MPSKENSKHKKEQIYILDSSAGTGKTYNLAKHYLKLLLTSITQEGEKISSKNILAITFTNKAAIEMKQRILELLKRLALNNWQDKEQIKQDIINSFQLNNKPKTDISQIVFHIIEDILQNYHYFQVQTIDSFVYTIASLYAFQLGLSPEFKIETDHQTYLRYCIDYMIDIASTNSRLSKLLTTFLDNYLTFENKKSWFPKKDIYEVISSLYEQTMYHGCKFNKFQKKLSLSILNQKLNGQLKVFFNRLPKESVYSQFISALEKLIRKYDNPKYLITLNDLSSKYFTKDEIPVKKEFKIDKSLQHQWKQIRKLISDFSEYSSYSIYNSYIDIFDYVENILYKVALEQDLVFLSELNKKIQEITNFFEYSVPELYLRLALNIQHCLIDEFQDTSILQWRNLNPIITEILAHGGTLFYVGDKKQAIYRYRGGDYRLFDIIPNFYPNFVCKKSILNKNFRSARYIIQFNNEIFSFTNLEKFVSYIEQKKELTFDPKNKKELFKVYSNSQQEISNDKSAGYVYGELITDTNSQEQEELIKSKLLSLIDNLINNGYNLSQIAVLVRKHPQGELVSNWLLEKGYPVESEKTLDVTKNSFIKEIFSLLKFLDTPMDELSFCSFILSRIFTESTNVPIDELSTFVFNVKKDKTKSIIYEFKNNYSKYWNQYFEKMFKVVSYLPISDVLIEIYKIFNFENLQVFKENYPFYYKLLDVTKEFEEKNCSLHYFIKQFESLSDTQKFINAKGQESIRILTIHKAKGLEFDIVILPFVKIDIEIGKQKDSTARFVIKIDDDNLEVTNTKTNAYLVKLTANISKYSPSLQKLYSYEYIKALIDELNVLYVGFTRAKEQLYFFVTEDDYTEFLFPWNNNCIIYGEFLPKVATQDKEQKQQNVILQLPVKHSSWYKRIAEENFPKLHSLFYKTKILEGEIIHKILSFIGNLYNQDLIQIVDTAILKTKMFYSYVETYKWDDYKNIVLKLINKTEFKQYFFIPDGFVLCEQEVVTPTGETRRVDRIIILENKIIVLDYKLTFPDEVKYYTEQVNEYKILISSIYNKPVEGLIIFLDTLETLEV
ncbi:MAG: UvrD-helicase domain-containing protein [Endomicrobia bacterium]|nr:UvrD-helicase domain-containing protein [Endomicrobiia bacterium]